MKIVPGLSGSPVTGSAAAIRLRQRNVNPDFSVLEIDILPSCNVNLSQSCPGISKEFDQVSAISGFFLAVASAVRFANLGAQVSLGQLPDPLSVANGETACPLLTRA